MNYKTCTKCGLKKILLVNFYANFKRLKKDGTTHITYHSTCKECMKEYRNEKYKNKE